MPEGLVSYSVAQGMVRGAVLELLDITYDGLEDPITGHLTGGLGQLADGKYGAENYRALGENGIVRGELAFLLRKCIFCDAGGLCSEKVKVYHYIMTVGIKRILQFSFFFLRIIDIFLFEIFLLHT